MKCTPARQRYASRMSWLMCTHAYDCAWKTGGHGFSCALSDPCELGALGAPTHSGRRGGAQAICLHIRSRNESSVLECVMETRLQPTYMIARSHLQSVSIGVRREEDPWAYG